MQHTSQRTKFDRCFFRLVGEPFVAIPDDRALAAARVDGDERDLVGRAFDDLGEVDVDAFVFQRLQAKLPFRI